MNRKRSIFLLSLFLVFSLIPIKAQEFIYRLVDCANNGEVVGEYYDYSTASRAFRRYVDDYQNLVLIEDSKVLMMEYGIVEFKTNKGCTFEVNYENLDNNQNLSVNGCLGIDAAYLKTVGNKVYFKLSGAVGRTNIENVILHPLESLNTRLSAYMVQDGVLYHEVKTQLEKDYYSINIKLGQAPDYLENDKTYYSYDGHYFYHNFYQMINDYLNEEPSGAINAQMPYFNYYQYLPHRSISNYQLKDLNKYFYDVLCFDRRLQNYLDLNKDNANDTVNESQYYGELENFIEYQYLYGANALMMLAVSIEESAYGKSLAAFEDNNLFGHAAFDTDEQRNAKRYSKVENSVYSHAKYYLSSRFCNHNSASYHGSFFGDLSSGMNVNYTSDPYWGEKTASNYLRLDSAMGSKDLNNYAIGISYKQDSLNLYADAELKNLKATIENVSNFAFIILEKGENYYKVQFDSTSDRQDYFYDFKKDVAYIEAKDIDLLLNDDKIQEKEYINVTIDGDGGRIVNKDKLTFNILKGHDLCINSFDKKGYEWTGFDFPTTNLENDSYFVAQYKKLEKLELHKMFNEDVQMVLPYDFANGKIKLYYENGKSKVLDLNSDMIKDFDNQTIGPKKVIINYGGLECLADITVHDEYRNLRSDLENDITDVMDMNNKGMQVKKDKLLQLKYDLAKIDYDLSFDEIRTLDKMLLDAMDYQYHIPDTALDIGISGFGLALDYPIAENRLFKDTAYVKISKASYKNRQKLSKISKAYGFKEAISFNLEFLMNLKTVKNINPFIIQLKIENEDKDKLYSVYRLDEDGNVYKCRSSQSADFIQFITSETGDFMILEIPSANVYDLENKLENSSETNSDIDIHGTFLNSMSIIALGIMIYIAIINKERLVNKEAKLWSVYKKSLLNVVFVQDEKLKN